MTEIQFLYFYLILFLFSWILIFIRAEMIRKLLKKARKYLIELNIIVGEPSVLYKVLTTNFFYDFKSYRILKQSIERMPSSIQKSHRRLKTINYLTYFSVFLVIGFALTAYKFF